MRGPDGRSRIDFDAGKSVSRGIVHSPFHDDVEQRQPIPSATCAAGGHLETTRRSGDHQTQFHPLLED